MKLWLLRPNPNRPRNNASGRDIDPFAFWNATIGFVMRAETEQQAREMVANGYLGFYDGYLPPIQYDGAGKHWLDPAITICVEIEQNGPPGMIIHEYRGD